MANEDKQIAFTATNRLYIRASVNMKIKSVERQMKNETNGEIIRLRMEEIKELNAIIGKL